MPTLDIQRRQEAPWWIWLVGAILLALLVWWIAAAAIDQPERVETVAPPERVAGARETYPERGEREVVPLVVIVRNPAAYMGRTIAGTATVAQVVSDRGFWLDIDGQRLFAVIDEPTREAIDLNAGQRLRFQGTVMDANRAAAIPGVQVLEPEARQILNQQPAFILVETGTIRILEPQPTGQAARPTAPAPAPAAPTAPAPPRVEEPAVRERVPRLADIAANPGQYVGQRVSGTANVINDVSDRGFWIDVNGARLFAVIDEPVPETIDINDGQRIRFSGVISDAERAAQIPGVQALEAETRQILEREPAFLLVDAHNITILSRPTPQ